MAAPEPSVEEQLAVQLRQTRRTLRAEADAMIVEVARRAAEANDFERFDRLMSRLSVEAESSGNQVADRTTRDALTRMDVYRVLITMIMITGLLVIIAYALHTKNANAGQYVSLFSGLAGISIGWLFGSGSASAVASAGRSGDE